jgi:hypothetical protein
MPTTHSGPCYGVHTQHRSYGNQNHHTASLQCNSLPAMSDLVTIFMSFISVKILAIQGPITIPVLSMAVRLLYASIQHLSLVITDSNTTESLGYIHVFSELCSLDIVIQTNTTSGPSLVASFRPWKLKHLKKLALKSSSAWSTRLAEFLCKCRFQALEALNLSLPTDTPSQASPHLASFCRGLPELRETTLELSGHTLGTILPHLPARSLEVHPFTSEAMQSLSPLTTSIRVPLSAVGGVGSVVWPALDGLVTSQHSSVKSVQR